MPPIKPQQIIERTHDSGKVSLSDEKIVWQKPDETIVEIEVKKVAVIGEYTTDTGPFSDDWFFVFVFTTGDWESISVYAEGIVGLTEYLSKAYSIDFSKYFLANSTEWQSFVRYPSDIEGKELFVIEPPKGYKPPITFVQQVKNALGLGIYSKSWEVDLSEAVKAKLGRASG